MTSTPHPLGTAPRLVRILNPLTRSLLRLGMPMGPNTLITIRGRRSGEPRTLPVAMTEIDGRLWVVAPYGNVNWVRNLRSAGRAMVRRGDAWLTVRAVELSADEARSFYADRLTRYVRGLPLIGRTLGPLLLRALGARAMLDDPASAARRFPVFELIQESA